MAGNSRIPRYQATKQLTVARTMGFIHVSFFAHVKVGMPKVRQHINGRGFYVEAVAAPHSVGKWAARDASLSLLYLYVNS